MLTAVQARMLFAVGVCEEMHALQLSKKPLRPALSKADFIRIITAAGIVAKKPRAIYRNLQAIEGQGLLNYHAHEIMLTPRGQKAFLRLRALHMPYLRIVMNAEKLLGKKFKTALSVV